jgi:ADP-heptose:LPS heptosyltransferase
MFTHIVDIPYCKKLISTQRRECLLQAGFHDETSKVHIQVPASSEANAAEKTGGGGWIHVSPFTTEDSKELPHQQLIELLNQLHHRFHSHQIILSCSRSEREQDKMKALLPRLDFTPWRVFSGDLDLLEFAAIVSHAVVHLGGDSGGLHVAWITGVPTVTWFRDYEGRVEWQPCGDLHCSMVGEVQERGIIGISTENLLSAVDRALLNYVRTPK